MLPYVEQQPLYSSCNFNWCSWYDIGGAINSTVFNTDLNVFVCPSDGKSAGPGSYNISNCNYFGSMGTTTQAGATASTGIFANTVSYGIQSIADGTSNTIAFSEGMAGDNINWTKWRDGIAAGADMLGQCMMPTPILYWSRRTSRPVRRC
jgi:Protein of unknown function (DUF1559)